MSRINYLAVVVAAVAAMMVSAVWYSPLLFGKVWMELRGAGAGAMAAARPPAGELAGELLRALVIAVVIAHFVVLLGIADWKGALRLGIWLWIGFYAALSGSVIHEHYPWKLYAIHVGDGLVRTVLMSVILGAWR